MLRVYWKKCLFFRKIPMDLPREFPWCSGKDSAGSAGSLGLIPGLGRSPAGGNGYPFQYSCLENSMNRGTWRTIVHEAAKSWTWLSTHKHIWKPTYQKILQKHVILIVFNAFLSLWREDRWDDQHTHHPNSAYFVLIQAIWQLHCCC